MIEQIELYLDINAEENKEYVSLSQKVLDFSKENKNKRNYELGDTQIDKFIDNAINNASDYVKTKYDHFEELDSEMFYRAKEFFLKFQNRDNIGMMEAVSVNTIYDIYPYKPNCLYFVESSKTVVLITGDDVYKGVRLVNYYSYTISSLETSEPEDGRIKLSLHLKSIAEMNKFINIEVEGELSDIKPRYMTRDGKCYPISVGIISDVTINKGT